MNSLRFDHLARLNVATCILAAATLSGLTACSQNQLHATETGSMTTPMPSQDNTTSNGGFWYPNVTVTYQGAAEPADPNDSPTVSLTVESPILNCELPATVEAIARTSFDNFIPGQQLSVDLSYGPVSPGPNQPCTYSVWRASPVSPG